MMLTYPDTGLTDSFKLYRKTKPTVTLIVEREVVAPVLFRNGHADRSEFQEFDDGELRAQINGEKFVSKERLTGLNLLRQLSAMYGDEDADDEVGAWTKDMEAPPTTLIADEYAYNQSGDLHTAINADTVTYGVAGTDGINFGMKSHAIEGYTYTTEGYNLQNKEVHNAVYESGTMNEDNDDKDQSSSLYEYAKVEPQNSILHFITLEAATPGMLLYTLHNILNTSVYGARGTRAGKTLDNSIMGIILSDFGTTLATRQLLTDYHESGSDLATSVAAYIDDVRRIDWEVYGDDLPDVADFPDWYHDLRTVAARRTEDAHDLLYDELHDLTTDALTTLVIDS